MPAVRQFPVIELGIDEVRPYWRNPRNVTDDAVNAVAESIKRYGYKQPVVVDGDNEIIIGHTRYAALRRLGYERIEVKVADTLAPAEVKQLRLIDNRVAELTFWDFDALVSEMADLDPEALAGFFPEVNAQGILQTSAATSPEGRKWDEVNTLVDFVCPSCFHSFTTDVSREQIMAGEITLEREETPA